MDRGKWGNMETLPLLQYTPEGIAILALVVLFYQLRRNGGGGHNKAILEELQLMNNNHLESLRKTIEDGNRKMLEVSNEANREIIRLLGEIKGFLQGRR